MVPAYNCSNYLIETLKAVLVQDPGPEQMQIEVVDDASTDADLEKLVAEHGRGRVTYFRQPENVGNLRNFETCLNRSKGHLVHLLHGDDLVYPGYYQKIGALFQRFPSVGAAFSRFRFITGVGEGFLQDEEASNDGILENWLLRLGSKQTIQYCALTVRREVYERLGGFYGVSYAEDWEMWMRIAHRYSFAYTPEVLAAYRLHEASVSNRSYADGQNLRDVQWVIQKIQNYLPVMERASVRRAAVVVGVQVSRPGRRSSRRSR